MVKQCCLPLVRREGYLLLPLFLSTHSQLHIALEEIFQRLQELT